MANPAPIALEGRHVRLEMRARAHKSDLLAVAPDADLWRFTPTQICSAEDLDAYVETVLSLRRAGSALPFASVDRSTGRAIGEALQQEFASRARA